MRVTSSSCFIFLASAYLFALLNAHDCALATEVPKQADAFVDAIGVDSHFNYANTPYVLYWSEIREELLRSGIRHIRDGGDPNNAPYLTRLDYLGKHGIRHSEGFNVGVTSEKIRAALHKFGAYVEFVEPANEYDSAQRFDPTWATHLVDEQKSIYSTVRADPDFAGITVLGPALARQYLYEQLGPLDDYEDAGNLHDATCSANPGYQGRSGIPSMTSLARHSTSLKPIWTTETGYNDDPVRPCSIPDDIIARYDPRTVAERFNAGEPRVYFYQLANVPSDPVFGGMGLLNAYGKPKPQFTALANLIALLSDPGPSFTLKPLTIEIQTSSEDVHHTLLGRRDGSFDLLLWRETPSWKPIVPSNIGGVRIPVEPVNVSIRTPSARARSYFQYDKAWNLRDTGIERESATRLTVQVTDAVSILELEPI